MAYTPLYGLLFFLTAMTGWLFIFHTRIWMPELKRRTRYFIKEDWRKLLSWHRARLNEGTLAEMQRRHERGEVRSQVHRRFEFCFLEGLLSQFPLHFAIFVITLVTSLSIASMGFTPKDSPSISKAASTHARKI
jgi:hypothetical protein